MVDTVSRQVVATLKRSHVSEPPMSFTAALAGSHADLEADAAWEMLKGAPGKYLSELELPPCAPHEDFVMRLASTGSLCDWRVVKVVAESGRDDDATVGALLSFRKGGRAPRGPDPQSGLAWKAVWGAILKSKNPLVIPTLIAGYGPRSGPPRQQANEILTALSRFRTPEVSGLMHRIAEGPRDDRLGPPPDADRRLAEEWLAEQGRERGL